MRYEIHNLDGTGPKRVRVFDMPPVETQVARWPGDGYMMRRDYWMAVTDVPCPTKCGGKVQWAEAGYVPGYRICDQCGRHFLAKGTADKPTLVLVRSK